MRKMIVLLILCSVVLGGVVPVFAQDETASFPACTEEELTATLEGLQAIDEGFQGLMAEFDLTSDPNSADYGASLVALDAIATGFWGEFYPEVPECAEAQGLVYAIGAIYDETLTIGLLANLAAWAEAGGDAETAGLIAEQVTARMEVMDEMMAEVDGMTFEELAAYILESELAACTEEELAAGAEAMGGAMEELGGMAEMMESPLELFALTEGAAYTYWNEAYDELATCFENEYIAFEIGTFLNDANIIAGLYANAMVEAEAGNAEVAEAMTAGAQAREAMMAEMMGMSE